MKDLNGKRVLVAGMGKSGIAAVELLRKHGADVRATDQKAAELKLPFPVLPQTEAVFTDTDLVVLSPGVPVDIPEVLAAKRVGVPVIGEVELAGWFLQGPVIGITGSNGKTTTTSLIGHILLESGVPTQVGGNIGKPPAAMIDGSKPDQWNVLELSSFQLETIHEFTARIAVCTNVTPDHLDRHHDFATYAAAKARLFETQRPGSFAVLNADDPTCVSYAAATSATTSWFSTSREVPGIFLRRDELILEGASWMRASDIPLPGMHNVENVMAGALAARAAGVPPDRIAAAVRTFPGVEHRLEFTRELRGVRWYNDSKATNVDATMKAIAAFPGNLWLILGGKDKGSDYTVMRDALSTRARGVLLIGAAAEKIADHLNGAVPMTHCGTLERAVEIASADARAGDIVVLAPACASFDQFQSYEHRGRVFKDLVRSLQE